MTKEIDRIIRNARREIATEPLCDPGQDQYVDVCHWSRTGWAIHDADGRCTCRPTTAVKPRQLFPAFRYRTEKAYADQAGKQSAISEELARDPRADSAAVR